VPNNTQLAARLCSAVVTERHEPSQTLVEGSAAATADERLGKTSCGNARIQAANIQTSPSIPVIRHPTRRTPWIVPIQVASARTMSRTRSKRAGGLRVRRRAGYRALRSIMGSWLIMEDRYRISPAAPEGMAAHSHTKDCSTAAIWCGCHLRAYRRIAAIRQL
jgi:hypothetical protein